MKRSLTIVTMTVPLLLLAGCVQSSTTEQQNATPPEPPVVADTDLAVPADFEGETAKSITTANYKAELDTIESEVN